jgi:serine/threonine protein kinase
VNPRVRPVRTGAKPLLSSAGNEVSTETKAGRYEIVGELGRGAMGIVYKAVDPVIGRPVAVKTIRLSEEGTGMTREELITRFQTEARAAGLLTHPNIVVVYDAGEADGMFFITMELVEGRSLQSQLDGQQTFPLPRVLRLMEQACSALQFAHERNVIHRDIKPANLMLTADDTLKITDFGTAKILQFGTTHQTAHVVGTPSYMSPEQVKGRPVDGRSDIFSLGVVLYEMVTGEKPFPGQNITTVIYKIVNEEPIPPRTLDPSIHPGLSYVITKALTKAPDSRYQSCRDMLEDLRNYRTLGENPETTMALPGHGGAGAAGSLRPPLAATQVLPGAVRTSYVKPPPEQRKRTGVWVLVSFLLLASIGYCGYRLRPAVQDLMQRTRENRTVSAKQKRVGPPSSTVADPPPATLASSEPAETNAAVDSDASPERPAPIKTGASAVNPEVASVKARVEQGLKKAGLADKVKVHGSGNTLTLSGRLNARDHRRVLENLKDISGDVHLVDHLEYADDSSAPSGGDKTDDRPRPSPGVGALDITSDVLGATTTLRGPAGQILSQCATPCRFDDLKPQRYSLEVSKEGYKPVQTAILIAAGQILDQRVELEANAKGLFITSHPSGADVFIDGAKQSGQTPVTLPLAPGQYNLVVKKAGFDAYSGQVQIKDNSLATLDVHLTQSIAHVAWADIRTAPRGAEILVDGNPTGRVTPARIQVAAGTHTVTLHMDGFAQENRTVSVDEGQTVPLNVALRWRQQ